MSLRTQSVEETRDLGEALAALLWPGDVVVLAGDLGTGKTALAQGIGRGLGIAEAIVSPSFVIVREYAGRISLVHVDVYRLDFVQELHDLGFEEVLDEERVTLIEWGDRVTGLLPEERLEVTLRAAEGPATRDIEWVALGPAWLERSDALAKALSPWALPGDGGRSC
ncbi:MAG TPA: tRNA (adenosine(37)-N6)-threonylcarbamoyltransferase complex ATPase subunit type 1 TsaE [Acidimicrobiia bacterium]|nr:tRNA (adenosine(37)-N6)-threonylcarbamoyltransferase complex ATPase subunit type 1 TsaE [Acidimicrobiia bacterium]